MSRLVEAVAPSRLGRDFRWLLASSWAANLGDGIALAAGPLLVASQTQSPILVALAALLQRLPWLLFGLWAGFLSARGWWGSAWTAALEGGTFEFLPVRFCLVVLIGGMALGAAGGLVAARHAGSRP